jgi:hypothetical protein
MPQVVNGILYPATTLVINGQSISGSFYKFQVLASGSVVGGSAGAPAHFKALKGANGVDLVPAGVGLFFPSGIDIEMQVTSASLDATSAPVLFYS